MDLFLSLFVFVFLFYFFVSLCFSLSIEPVRPIIGFFQLFFIYFSSFLVLCVLCLSFCSTFFLFSSFFFPYALFSVFMFCLPNFLSCVFITSGTQVLNNCHTPIPWNRQKFWEQVFSQLSSFGKRPFNFSQRFIYIDQNKNYKM